MQMGISRSGHPEEQVVASLPVPLPVPFSLCLSVPFSLCLSPCASFVPASLCLPACLSSCTLNKIGVRHNHPHHPHHHHHHIVSSHSSHSSKPSPIPSPLHTPSSVGTSPFRGLSPHAGYDCQYAIVSALTSYHKEQAPYSRLPFLQDNKRGDGGGRRGVIDDRSYGSSNGVCYCCGGCLQSVLCCMVLRRCGGGRLSVFGVCCRLSLLPLVTGRSLPGGVVCVGVRCEGGCAEVWMCRCADVTPRTIPVPLSLSLYMYVRWKWNGEYRGWQGRTGANVKNGLTCIQDLPVVGGWVRGYLEWYTRFTRAMYVERAYHSSAAPYRTTVRT